MFKFEMHVLIKNQVPSGEDHLDTNIQDAFARDN